jgi:hypothetical protein
MPRLVSVDVTYGPTIEVRFTTTRAVFEACDTAVLQLIDTRPGGSELGVRIARGRVVDSYLWDTGRRLRQRLPTTNVVADATGITCSVPLAVLPLSPTMPTLTAMLLVNGAVVDAEFPVTIRARDRALSRRD